MPRNYAENAVMCKVRALYGKRLTGEDYEQLLSKKTVSEVAAYLKSETCYAEDLREVKEDMVRRGQLETLVRRRTLSIYTRLMKYVYRDTLAMRLYIMKSEIEQLLAIIRLLNSDETARYIVELPVYIARLMSFDLFALADIRSFDDLLEVLERSAYFRIVGRFRPSGAHGIIDITSCEAALISHYYSTALEIVEREYRGDARDDLRRLLLLQLTNHNANVIYRMRRYLGVGREMVEPRVVRVKGARTRLEERLLDAPDVESMQDVLSRQRIVSESGLDWKLDPQELTSRVLAIRKVFNHRLFRFSTSPEVVMICYMTLLEIEQSNIVSIVEGIRYKIPPEEIRRLLCG